MVSLIKLQSLGPVLGFLCPASPSTQRRITAASGQLGHRAGSTTRLHVRFFSDPTSMVLLPPQLDMNSRIARAKRTRPRQLRHSTRSWCMSFSTVLLSQPMVKANLDRLTTPERQSTLDNQYTTMASATQAELLMIRLIP